MSDEWNCVRCGGDFQWEQLTSTAAGNLFCRECFSTIDPASEPIRKCPVEGSNMKKQLVQDLFLIDICPDCGGVWLDKGELKIIKKTAKDEGWNWGFVIGSLF
jgi:hypothetical protein